MAKVGMGKLKILHILNTDGFSGAENVAITMIRHYREWVDATYMSLDGKIRDNLRECGIKYYPVRKLSVMNIKRVIYDVRPDLIHAHDYTASTLAALTGTKTAIISHLHNNAPWIRKKCIKSLSFLAACHKSSRILTVSDCIMREYVFGKYFSGKTQMIGNPIDVSSIRKRADDKNWEKNYDVAFLGRLASPKNPLLFLEIMKMVKERKKDLRIVLIGDGPMKAEAIEKTRELGLTDNVEFTGFRKNPYPILKKAKILCMPSSYEGYGLAAVEALALGKPVVSSGAGGLPEIVDRSCGRICRRKEEYVGVIRSMLDNDALYSQMSSNACARAEELDNVSRYARDMVRIYRECLER